MGGMYTNGLLHQYFPQGGPMSSPTPKRPSTPSLDSSTVALDKPSDG